MIGELGSHKEEVEARFSKAVRSFPSPLKDMWKKYPADAIYHRKGEAELPSTFESPGEGKHVESDHRIKLESGQKLDSTHYPQTGDTQERDYAHKNPIATATPGQVGSEAPPRLPVPNLSATRPACLDRYLAPGPSANMLLLQVHVLLVWITGLRVHPRM
jgi:hypothetical protein